MKKGFFTLLIALLVAIPIFSQTGKNIEFDGKNREMVIPHHTDFNFSVTEDYTISVWLNVNSYVTNARFVSKRGPNSAANKSGYEMWGSNSAVNFYALNTPNPAGQNTFSAWGSVRGATNKWIHLAFVVSGKADNRVVYQYQDGILAKSSVQAKKNVSAYEVTNDYDVKVGFSNYGGGHFNGKMDNLRFYKKALSAEEVKADMTSTVTATTEGLIAAYDFENIANGIVADIKNNHPAQLLNFPTVGNVEITKAKVSQDINFSGRGNDNEEILKIELNTKGNSKANISNIVLKMTGTTDIKDVEDIKIYNTKSVAKFDPRNPAAKGAILIGTAKPATDGITVKGVDFIYPETNYLWVTYKVKDSAKEGNKIDAEIVSINYGENLTYNFKDGNPQGSREIMLARTLVLAPGDFGSANYRIPAICTMNDGTLITITDKRKYNSVDLPEDIDIVSRRSVDGGKTWSNPITMAEGKGKNKGFGDAVVIHTKSDKLIALFVGGPGLWTSTPQNPMRTYMSVSEDGALSWSAPKDITPQIYGSQCSDPVRQKWQGLFFGSGRGLETSNGRIMAVVAARVPEEDRLQNFIVYSDDMGKNWKVSNKAMAQGDEAKVIELNNGNILISSRTSGHRLWAISEDGGVNWGKKNSWQEIWGNACDADIIRYTSTKDGFDKDRILHTLPNNAQRRNVTMWISYDETKTWPIKKTICPNTSCYSSITKLNDGTIGVYLEEDESVPYKMYFLNFSLDWLTNGADSYTKVGTGIVSKPELTPVEGRYGEEQTVTITSATKDAKIYYTTDGTTPNINSTLYTAPFKIEKSLTIKAIAVKSGMANSVIASSSYILGWITPAEYRAVGADRYITSATTENSKKKINYSVSEAPKSHYVHYTKELIEVEQGAKFNLKLEGAKGEGDGLQWCQAIILVDWNRDFKFTEDERVAIIGNRAKDNGNTVLSINQEIAIPTDAQTTKPTRLRVVYTDGWRPANFSDLGEDPIDKGRCYDFDIKVIESKSAINNLLSENIKVSPNPVKEFLKIEFPKDEKYNISIFSLDGKKIESKTVYTNTTINVANYKSNVYLLNIKNEAGNEKTIKIVKK